MVLAHFTRTRGNKGELCAIPLTDYPERFQAIRTVDVTGVSYELERVWYHKDQPVFKLRGVDSIGDAEKLVGQEVRIPASERWQPPEGEFFYSDLVGCRMVDNTSGSLIGTVIGWQDLGDGIAKQTQILLEVDDGGKEPLLVPFAGGLLKKMDLAAREIRAELPPGLAELNR